MRVFFTNLGCKLNQAEIERLARDFRAAGHRVVSSLAEAELHVVNSCTVTHTAARGSRKAAGRGRRKGLRTVLTGCHASEPGVDPETAAERFGVDLVVPNPQKDRLLECVHAAFPDAIPSPFDGGQDVPYAPLPFGHTRALLKIEDGCNMRCAFCIIPQTRGRQRSRPPAEILAEARALVAAGHREIVVTGVQISAYRWEGQGLFELTGRLLRESGAPRLRLTSIAPWDLDERLLSLWESRSLCRHLHLSLQSGSTATLRRMRRPYSAESYARLLERVRKAIPGVAVTTDVIAGFPGESEGEFEESLAFTAAAGFARVHAFPFSPRPGTEAAGLPDPVPPETLHDRMRRMLEVATRAEESFRRAALGRRETVLWEKPQEGMGRGLTDNYLRVYSPAGAALRNRFSEVELVALADDGIAGIPSLSRI